MAALSREDLQMQRTIVLLITVDYFAFACGSGGLKWLPEATLVVGDHSADFGLDVGGGDGAGNAENLHVRHALFLVDGAAAHGTAATTVHSALFGLLFGHFSFDISLVENLFDGFICFVFLIAFSIDLIVVATLGLRVINVGNEGTIEGVDALKVDCLGLDDVGEGEGKVLGVRV